MKELTLKILIRQPVSEVFEFTINPNNTPKWISGMQIEETNEWPINLGTVYRNTSDGKSWDEYNVTALKENNLFELTSSDGTYRVAYFYEEAGQGTMLTYFEEALEGELENPFKQEYLEKLKEIMKE